MLDAVGPGVILLVVLMWAAVIIATLLMPFAIFSIASSLRGIVRELEHMNGRPGPRERAIAERAAQYTDTIPRADLGHQLLK